MEYDRRKVARTEGRRYCDSNVLTYQAARMPEQLRLKIGGVTNQQTAVYEDLARNVPGFLPISLFVPKPVPFSTTQDEFDSIFEKLSTDLDHYVQTILGPQVVPWVHTILEILSFVRRDREDLYAARLVQKTTEALLGLSVSSMDPELIMRHRDMYLQILKTIQDPRTFGSQFFTKHLILTLLGCREEFRFDQKFIDILVRSQLINLPEFDIQLAHIMENGQNDMAVNFAVQLVQLIDERSSNLVSANDLIHTLDVLARQLTKHLNACTS